LALPFFKKVTKKDFLNGSLIIFWNANKKWWVRATPDYYYRDVAKAVVVFAGRIA
jgi:hypothetical protein